MIGTEHTVIKNDNLSLGINTTVYHRNGIATGGEYVNLARDHIIAYGNGFTRLGDMEQILYKQGTSRKDGCAVCGDRNISLYTKQVRNLNRLAVRAVYVNSNTNLLIRHAIEINGVGQHPCVAGDDIHVGGICRKSLIISVDLNLNIVKHVIGRSSYAEKQRGRLYRNLVCGVGDGIDDRLFHVLVFSNTRKTRKRSLVITDGKCYGIIACLRKINA